MLKILLSGASGAMGKNVVAAAENSDNLTIAAGVDKRPLKADFPVYESFDGVKEKTDVIIDFSNVSVLDEMLRYAVDKKIPLIIATTGYSEKQLDDIKRAAKTVPILKAANFSLGVNVLCALVRSAAEMLGGDFDIEIVEKHHHNKLDAPSGTALTIADTVNGALNNSMNYEFDRHSKRAKRAGNEIGIHSVRGGTIVGQHDVIFAGENEVLTLSHTAESRSVFAVGALKAAEFIVTQKPGLYDISDMLRI